MTSLEKAAEAASSAKAEYEDAHKQYLKATPGRDLTIKQGEMQRLRLAFRAALEHFFDEYEKSKLL